MRIDLKKRRAVLARKVGGFSGPAVKPVALRMVWQTANAVNIPVLGMGGISTGTDAAEFLAAGALCGFHRYGCSVRSFGSGAH